MRSLSFVKRSTLLLAAAFCLFVFLAGTASAQCDWVQYRDRQAFDLDTVSAAPGFYYTSADFDGDGHTDVLQVYYRSASSTQLVLFRGVGDGTFLAPVITGLAAPNGFPTAADIDGDGKKDLVLWGTGGISVLKYQAGGTFGTPVVFPTSSLFILGDPADTDGDGRADLLVRDTSVNPNVVRILYGKADLTFDQGSVLGNGSGGFAADFTGDGWMDVAAVDFGSSGAVLDLYANAGGRTFGAAQATSIVAPPIAVIDANGDGVSELISAASGPDPYSVTLYTYRAKVPEPFGKTAISSPSFTIGTPFIGDFDGDGNVDAYFGKFSPQVTLFGDGMGGFTASAKTNYAPGQLAGDLDGDGKSELLTFSDSIFNKGTYDVLLVGNTRCLRPPTDPAFQSTQDTLTKWRPSTGFWHDDPYSETTYSFGATGDTPIIADFDGDGVRDSATFRNATGDWTIRRSSTTALSTVHFGADGDIPAPADFDGDGKADLAVFRQSSGDWYISRSSDNGFTALHWGQTGDQAVPADFDGDGKADLCVFRPSNGAWYWLRSTDGVLGAVGFGQSGDKPLPADLDNDGKADLAVFRPSTGYWFFLRTRDYRFLALQWGQNGDVPFTYYEESLYLGNFGRFYPRPTIAVFRPSIRGYYIMRDSVIGIPTSAPADEMFVGSFYYD